MIIIFTNRKVVQTGVTAGDERMFGETQNLKGSSELRIALAEQMMGTISRLYAYRFAQAFSNMKNYQTLPLEPRKS